MLKKFISKLSRRYGINTDQHGFSYTVEELVGMKENAAALSLHTGKIIDDSILRYKKSKTVFILGSGPSINKITESQWSEISRNDSIGFNFSIIHEFVPTYFFHQGSREIFEKVLSEELHRYLNVPIILRGSALAKGKFDPNKGIINLLKQHDLYYLCEYPISSRAEIDINLLIRYLDELGFMSHGHISKFVPKWRSTIGLMLMISYQMGYKNIVLCGVDMLNNDHFWDQGPYSKKASQYGLPRSGTIPITQFTNTGHSRNTVPEYIYTLSEWMEQRSGVKVTILSDKTILFPRIPLYMGET